MASYTLSANDGTQDVKNRQSGDLFHDVSIRAQGTNPSGTLTLAARKPGSDVFESIPDGSFDLSSLTSLQFSGAVSEWRITISSIANVDALYLTDTSQRI